MALVVAAYGGGTNSTALLVEYVRRKLPVDLILFADTGGEKPETYQYIKLFSKWLTDNGYPEIKMVHRVNKDGEQLQLEQQCLEKKMLPSLAYGFKKCSQKFKRQPQDKFCNNWPPAKEAWKRGEKVVKLIGFDAAESRRAKIKDDEKYTYEYPLIEWNMARDECVASIKAAGLPLPGKSSCFFCPASKKHEIIALPPALRERAVAIEQNAKDNLWICKGLGRNFSWQRLLENDDAQLKLFPVAETDIACDCYDGEG